MTSIADPYPDWTARLAARFEAAAKDPSAWLALIGWLVRLALARICAFGAAPALLYGDLPLRRDLRAMVRLAETMLRVAISEAAAAIAYYRVHPEQALPTWLRDGLGSSTPRPGSARQPQREQASRLPSFRVSDWSSGPTSAAKPAKHRPSASREGSKKTGSSQQRAASGGTQGPQPSQRLGSRSRSAQRDVGGQGDRGRRTGPSPARLMLRLIAVQRALPQVNRYAWRCAKAQARQAVLRRGFTEASRKAAIPPPNSDRGDIHHDETDRGRVGHPQPCRLRPPRRPP